MKASEGRLGRVFVIRFEDGDKLPECIERFAEEKGVTTGHVILVGGIGSGRVVVGPENAEDRPPQPMLLPISGVNEVAGVGCLPLMRMVNRCSISMLRWGARGRR
jgi:predicted DNA-binding protein with PD1-like motif